MPGLGRRASAGGVQRRRVFAQLQHFAGHQNAPPRGRPRGQRANHRAQRFGIRVIAVVQNAWRRPSPQSARACRPAVKRRERGNGGIQIDARLQRNGQAGHGIHRVVRAQQLQREAALALPGAILDMQAGGIFAGGKNARIGAWVHGRNTPRGPENRARTATRKASSLLRKATPLAGSAATSSNLARAMPACPSAKFSTCALPTLVTTPQSGAAMRASAAISPEWFMPISTTAISCCGVQAQQLQRQPEAVVQIALRLEHDHAGAHRRGNRVLGGGFAGRAGDGHNGAPPLAAHMRGQRLQARAADLRSPAADAASAASGREATRVRDTTALTAPRSSAAATKSWPSNRSPRTAKNSSPGRTVRESIE